MTSTPYPHVARRKLLAPLNQLKLKRQLSELLVSSFSRNDQLIVCEEFGGVGSTIKLNLMHCPKLCPTENGRLTNSTSAPPRTSKAPTCKRDKGAELSLYAYTDKLPHITQMQTGAHMSAEV